MRLEGLYERGYVDAVYADAAGLRQRYERVVALAPEQSDNAGRVERVARYGARRFGPTRRPSILDIGSGLCVFLRGMRARGWVCTALDPDQRAAEHAREVVGVAAICADFLRAQDLPRFDAVTLNKVLEHVQDPRAMLARARGALGEGGFVYVEVPDGELAFLRGGPERQEFYVEHWHAFSAASLALVCQAAGFRVEALERLHEPSGKYTLWAFLSSAG